MSFNIIGLQRAVGESTAPFIDNITAMGQTLGFFRWEDRRPSTLIPETLMFTTFRDEHETCFVFNGNCGTLRIVTFLFIGRKWRTYPLLAVDATFTVATNGGASIVSIEKENYVPKLLPPLAASDEEISIPFSVFDSLLKELAAAKRTGAKPYLLRADANGILYEIQNGKTKADT